MPPNYFNVNKVGLKNPVYFRDYCIAFLYQRQIIKAGF